MKTYIVGSKENADLLSQESFRISFPVPFDPNINLFKIFDAFPHSLDLDTFGWAIQIPLGYRKLHWFMKLVAKAQGNEDNLTSSDLDFLKDQFERFNLSTYKTELGEMPYQSLDDLILVMTEYWFRMKAIYPNLDQLETIRIQFIERDRIFLDEIIPDWVTYLPFESFFSQKWRPVAFNNLNKWKLSSLRFSGLTEDSIDAIVKARKEGVFRSFSNLKDKVSLNSDEKYLLENQISEGSLVFPNQT